MGELHLEAIRWVLGQKVSVIPLQRGSKIPDAQALLKVGSCIIEDGKTKASWKQYQTRLPKLDELKIWFDVLGCNLGLVCGTGKAGSLVVIDFDDLNWFFTWRAAYPQVRTRIIGTPRPGIHVYFKVKEPTKSYDPIKGIEIQGRGNYVCALPSIRPDGCYMVIDRSSILTVDRLEEVFPAGLLEERKQPAFTSQSAPRPAQIGGSEDPWAAAMQVGNRQMGTDLIGKIKQTIPISMFIPGPHRQQGQGEYGCHCPITRNHKNGDAHPSAFYREDTQSFYCRVCSNPKHWDVINLFANIQGISNQAAISELARML